MIILISKIAAKISKLIQLSQFLKFNNMSCVRAATSNKKKIETQIVNNKHHTCLNTLAKCLPMGLRDCIVNAISYYNLNELGLQCYKSYIYNFTV